MESERRIAEIKGDMASICAKISLIIDPQIRHKLILSFIKYLVSLI